MHRMLRLSLGWVLLLAVPAAAEWDGVTCGATPQPCTLKAQPYDGQFQSGTPRVWADGKPYDLSWSTSPFNLVLFGSMQTITGNTYGGGPAFTARTNQLDLSIFVDDIAGIADIANLTSFTRVYGTHTPSQVWGAEFYLYRDGSASQPTSGAMRAVEFTFHDNSPGNAFDRDRLSIINMNATSLPIGQGLNILGNVLRPINITDIYGRTIFRVDQFGNVGYRGSLYVLP